MSGLGSWLGLGLGSVLGLVLGLIILGTLDITARTALLHVLTVR